MDHHKAATPPATPSRASTAALDSNRQTPISQSSELAGLFTQTGAQVNQDPVQAFKPLQMLMETTVSVEYGDNLTATLTIHEELLRCHSTSFAKMHAKAKPLREQYEKSKDLMDQMAKFVFPEVTAKQFEEAGMRDQTVKLIQSAYEKHPLPEYQSTIKKVVDGAVADQIDQKNYKPDPSINGTRKKDTRDMSREAPLATRLALLKPRGVQGVAEALFSRLHKIKKTERGKAKTDPVRAAAQRRIILPGVNDITVQSLVQWIYRGTLYYKDAGQLYALLTLASELGVEALREMCLSKLSTGATETIQHARAQGIPLLNLLGYGSESANDLLDVVFISVFKDETPPERLLKLVVTTLAENLNMELWMQVRDLIGHGMALQLIEAMIIQQEVKTELSDQTSVKSEVYATTDELLSLADKKHQLAHIG